MYKTKFRITKMDCPSEEKLIRMKMEGLVFIEKMDFNLEKRELTLFHSQKSIEIENRLAELNLGSTFIETVEGNFILTSDTDKNQSKLLWAVLLINFSFFIIEIVTGFISNSMGLVADSLDMFADSIVYGLSLWAVGAAINRKKRVARLSGYFQLLLAFIGLIEVVRRFFGVETVPEFRIMILVSMVALAANSICLYLLQKSKSKDAHMKASMIFTSNDVIINAGVILAGLLVLVTNSRYPDLIVGSIVFLIVIRGAIRILKLGKQ